MKYVLGVDLGTTAIKAAVFDENGRLRGSHTCEYTLLTPSPGLVELDAESYVMAFREAARQAIAKAQLRPWQLLSLAISAQGETLMFVDTHGHPLMNAIVWMDNRATREADELEKAMGGREAVHKTTGQVSMSAAWPASKILWVKRHRPEVFYATAKFLLIEDYFLYLLTGEYTAEDSLLCSTMLWDINTRKYWPGMLSYLGINESQLPDIRLSGTPVGKVSESGAALLGLSEDTLVCMGALDQACGAIGVGNVMPGMFSESTGAALATVAIADRIMIDSNGEMPCFAGGIPGSYMIHSFSTGGIVMRWFRDEFCATEMDVERATGVNAYQLIDALVNSTKPGADGMMMLPHLQGSGAPDSNALAKGAFLNVTMSHGRAHFARAIMEGVTMVLLRMKEATESMGVAVSEVRSLSGGAQSAAWCQIKADATGLTVRTVKNSESAACLGAAILAGVGAGLWPSAQEVAGRFVENAKEYLPNPENKAVYDRLLLCYKRLLVELQPCFARS